MVNKEYWNREYAEYWQSAVTAANESVLPRAKSIPSDQVFSQILDPYLSEGINILDCGCGWGRMGPLTLSKGVNYSGFDFFSQYGNDGKRNPSGEMLGRDRGNGKDSISE